MTFNLQLLPREELLCEDANGGHIYTTPIGKLHSVTNILSQLKDKRYLAEWRGRIGNTKADEIVRQSQKKGTAIHKLAEKYLLNDPDWSRGAFAVNLQSFNKVKPILDGNVKTVYGVELPLWSSVLKTAGTTDAVVKWQGYNSILDFKTSRRSIQEKSEKIRIYKLQAVVYSMMVEERYNIEVPYSTIIIIVDHKLPRIVSFHNDYYRGVAHDIFTKERV